MLAYLAVVCASCACLLSFALGCIVGGSVPCTHRGDYRRLYGLLQRYCTHRQFREYDRVTTRRVVIKK